MFALLSTSALVAVWLSTGNADNESSSSGSAWLATGSLLSWLPAGSVQPLNSSAAMRIRPPQPATVARDTSPTREREALPTMIPWESLGGVPRSRVGFVCRTFFPHANCVNVPGNDGSSLNGKFNIDGNVFGFGVFRLDVNLSVTGGFRPQPIEIAATGMDFDGKWGTCRPVHD